MALFDTIQYFNVQLVGMTNLIIINYEHKPIIRNIIRPVVTHLFIFSQEKCHKYLLIPFSICHEAAEVRIKLQP